MINLWFLLVLLYTVTCVLGNDINFKKINASYGKTISLSVNVTVGYVIIYQDSNTTNPYRVKARSTNASVEFPILLVVRQDRQVTSWQVPYVIETTKKDYTLQFYNTSKTMCHDHMKNIAGPGANFSVGPLILSQSFILVLSTASTKNVDIYLELEEETNFYVQVDKSYPLSISPSEPRYVFYRFNKNASDTIVVEVDSDDDVCLTVSVQDSQCPVLDSNKDITYEGIYQTINKKGAMTIARKHFEWGFFLVFVAKPDNYDCSQANSIIPMPRSVLISPLNITSSITVKISYSISMREYIIACLGTLLIFSIFGIVFLISSIVFNRHGTISDSEYIPMEINKAIVPLSDEQIRTILSNDHLTLDTFARNPERIKQRSFNYLSHILSIAIFYSIPVIQLVVTYQRIVNLSGDQDMCYYNFLCAHPAFGFTDFNHIYSNIGYIITGIFFVFSVVDRQTIIKVRKGKGIPAHYGLFYAMGVALIIEGLLSACYHICPSQSNYQFDTSFMYIMEVLIMVKLYQNRHPDINATAYSTFTVLGAAIFMAMIGILDGSLLIWIAFAICYSILVVVLSFKIYFFNYVLKGIDKFKNDVLGNEFSINSVAPIRRGRFILLLMANIANYSVLITGLCLYSSQITDFGTFLLGLLMFNCLVHCTFYISMKIYHKEKICFEALIYGLLALACWAAAGYFFLDPATLWTVTPAESRQWNQGCILISFYDKHDVWHLISAPALYFTFMFLMYLDDDLADKQQTEIPVF